MSVYLMVTRKEIWDESRTFPCPQCQQACLDGRSMVDDGLCPPKQLDHVQETSMQKGLNPIRNWIARPE